MGHDGQTARPAPASSSLLIRRNPCLPMDTPSANIKSTGDQPHIVRRPNAGCSEDLASSGVVARVRLDVAAPFFGHLVLGEAGVDRAGVDAGVAVDALGRVDMEMLSRLVARFVLRWMDAVDRTYLDARVVLRPDAGLGYHVRHRRSQITLLRLRARRARAPRGRFAAAGAAATRASTSSGRRAGA